MNTYREAVEAGNIVSLEQERQAAQLEWNPHAKFTGVALKHLVTGAATNGKFSCHLVRVQAGCEIGEHTHPGKMELHEVIEGRGTGFLVNREIPYLPGTVVIVPEDLPHRVVAGDEDLYLLAKFIPALL